MNKINFKKIETWQTAYMILSTLLVLIFIYGFHGRFRNGALMLLAIALFSCYLPLIQRGMKDDLSDRLFSLTVILLAVNALLYGFSFLYFSFV